MEIKVIGGEMSQQEINAYREKVNTEHPDWNVKTMVIKILDNAYVEIEYEYTTKKFDRIRRITGYLVGDLDRFNNAKKAEVGDRVKHNISQNGGFEDVYLDGRTSVIDQISDIKAEQKTGEEPAKEENKTNDQEMKGR